MFIYPPLDLLKVVFRERTDLNFRPYILGDYRETVRSPHVPRTKKIIPEAKPKITPAKLGRSQGVPINWMPSYDDGFGFGSDHGNVSWQQPGSRIVL